MEIRVEARVIAAIRSQDFSVTVSHWIACIVYAPAIDHLVVNRRQPTSVHGLHRTSLRSCPEWSGAKAKDHRREGLLLGRCTAKRIPEMM